VGEASTIKVCVAVGRIVSVAEVVVAIRGGSVGNGVPVDSISGAGVGVVVQAVRMMRATTMDFFIEGNYMPMPINVIARSVRCDEAA
jgi:hypothetical protein